MVTDFQANVYKKLCTVPKGRVTTYKYLARAINSSAYRAVGSALNKNPYAPRVPCHRVVNSDGKVGGFARGQREKIRLLESEGIVVVDGRVKDFQKRLIKIT